MTEQLAQVMAVVGIVAGLAMAGEAISEFLIVPVWKKIMELIKFDPDGFLVPYVAGVPALILVLLSGQSLFAGFLPQRFAVVGVVVTAVIAMRGSNYVHQFFTGFRKTSKEPPLSDEDRAALTEYHLKEPPEG